MFRIRGPYLSFGTLEEDKFSRGERGQLNHFPQFWLLFTNHVFNHHDISFLYYLTASRNIMRVLFSRCNNFSKKIKLLAQLAP